MRVLACLSLQGVIVCAAMMLPAPASAASRADWEQCADIRNRDTADRTIAACTRIVDDRSEPDRTKIARAYSNRGNAWRLVGDARRAIMDYSEAIRLDPDLRDGYAGRGIVWSRVGDQDRAIADFDRAIRLDPNDPGSLAGRCWARAAAGRDLGRALADCNESLRLRPGAAQTLNSRGLVQLKRGAPDRAVADYAAAVAQNGRDADSLFGRGIARLKLGDLADGEADIAAAGAIAPGIADDFVGYGVARVVAGALPTPAAAASAPDPAAGRRDYEFAAQVGTRAAWDAFLKAYPSGLHADLARAQLEKLRAAELEATGAIDRAKAEQDKTDRLARAQEALLEQERLDRLEAERRGASQPSPPLAGAALVKEIKRGLAQLGCYAGPIDDKWTNALTRSAVKKFAAAVHLAAATERPTQDLLDAVRSSSGVVCASAAR